MVEVSLFVLVFRRLPVVAHGAEAEVAGLAEAILIVVTEVAPGVVDQEADGAEALEVEDPGEEAQEVDLEAETDLEIYLQITMPIFEEKYSNGK